MSAGETLVILGPSGAGKTSLLRLLAGLERADAGSIRLDGTDLTNVPSQQRHVALVSQEDSLFPHLSVYDNLAFGMRVQHRSRSFIGERIAGYARALEIDDLLAVRPAKLSGGQRQRAALARALLSDPRVLLLDEPFAHLDPQLRSRVRDRFRDARRLFSGAVIHVTHDHDEAHVIGDRLAIMLDGEIVQSGTPQSVYDAPADVRVARFFGSPPMNLLCGDTEIAGIRPEHVQVRVDGPLQGTIEACETAGADAFLYVRTSRGVVVARIPSTGTLPAPGERAGLVLPAEFVRRFDARSGTLID